MKITIETQECSKEGLTLADVLMLTTLKYNNSFEVSINNLISQGYITRYGIPGGTITLTQKGCNTLQDIICNSALETNKKRELGDLAEKLQSIYPEGKTNGYYWRGSKKEIETKLKRFLTTYGSKWTNEQIIAATKHYVDDNLGNPYMRLLKYFILKDGSSDLAEVLENMNQDNIVQSDFRCTTL